MNPNKKWLDLGIGGISVAVWLVMRQILNSVWDLFRLPLVDALPVALPEILAFLLAIALFVILRRNAKVKEFGLEVISELSKVTWPTQKETMISTGVIIIMVGIASVLLFVFDTAWGTVTRIFLEL